MDDNEFSLDELIAQHPIEVSRAIDKFLSEQRLIHFIEAFWQFVEPGRVFVNSWAIEAIAEHLEAVTSGEIKRLLINVPPGFMKSLTANVFWPSWSWGPLNIPTERFLSVSYSQSLTIRDNVRFRQVISSDLYKALWGDRFGASKEQYNLIKVGNNKTGWKLAASIGGTVTGERAGKVVLDDPNSVAEAESDAILESTKRWFLETLPSRLQDLRTDAIVVIQQRTSERDVSGIILENGLDYDHLCIPMYYEPGRHCVTSIGWQDPRGLDDDGIPLDGIDLEERLDELAFPERFPLKEVKALESTMGPYACTPHESPILMGNLSLKPIGEVKVGDEVIGFGLNPHGKDSMEFKHRRNRLVKSNVVSVYSSIKPIVKITLDSGEIVRCTADHKWFRRSRGPSRPQYLPANVGSPLTRICDPKLPTLSYEEQRMAGWLSGFFDGEGSVTVGKRKENGFEHYNPSSQICFYQGAGRNLPLCEKLEEYLKYFDFNFSCRHYVREDRKKPCEDGFFENRHYRLVKTGVREYQRFLHIVQPTKWRQRIMDAACKGKFRQGFERVVSIEPNGEEMTYALETTTGNYVVWGLASSNSAGQLQQRPQPRGGGIFKEEWWNQFPPEDWPEPKDPREKVPQPKYSYICAALDTALTEKEENDYSALTVWGVWHSRENPKIPPRIVEDPNGMLRMSDNDQPKAILVHAWKKRLHLYGPPEYKPPHMTENQWNDPLMMAERQRTWGLMEWVIHTCKKYNVDNLLIEDKAAGHTVHQELARLNVNQMWSTQLVDPRNQDKVARAYSIQHLFSNGIIYGAAVYDWTEKKWRFPSWLEAVINEMGSFPKAAHDDLTDSCVYALRHLRDIGVLLRRDEAEREFTEELTWKGRQGALYEL